jgi:hypothetical protein
MTLREKFETKSSIDTPKEAKAFAKECEDIADEFAIGFAEWLVAREFGYAIFQIKDGILETYKKEKEYDTKR